MSTHKQPNELPLFSDLSSHLQNKSALSLMWFIVSSAGLNIVLLFHASFLPDKN